MGMSERRGQLRCVKNIGMHCTLLNGNAVRTVFLRNFSVSGLFLETTVQIMPGTYIVLRSINANDAMNTTQDAAGPQYELNTNDPEVCSLFRSHTVAKVQRCEQLKGHYVLPRYGVAAEIQMLTD